MSINHLNAAAFAARYLASTVAAIRGLLEEGASKETIKRFSDELNKRYPDARQAIKAAEKELRQTRDRAVRLGDITAPTAHEAAVKMVHALNYERCPPVDINGKRYRIEVVGRKRVRLWPDADEVLAEIDLEYSKAQSARQPAQRTGRPRKEERPKEHLVISALVKHHRYQPACNVDNWTPAQTAQLAALASGKNVKVSVATVSRFFKGKFPNYYRGYDGYVAACNRDARVNIGMLLALWQGDVAEHLADLLPPESGRDDDD